MARLVRPELPLVSLKHLAVDLVGGLHFVARELFTCAWRNRSLILGSRRLVLGRRGVHQCRERVPADWPQPERAPSGTRGAVPVRSRLTASRRCRNRPR